jgi:tellurite resistance protein
LVAVAWADGRLEAGETSVIEGLLSGFDASAAEEEEILEYARTRRSLEQDIPLAELGRDDRELLFANAALLSHADGEQTSEETHVLRRLARVLGFSLAETNEILASVSAGERGRRSAQPPRD